MHSKLITKQIVKILFSFVYFGEGFLCLLAYPSHVLCKYWCIANTCVCLEALLDFVLPD